MFRLKAKKKTLIGVISDTHGLLRPEVVQVFTKVDLILHAGDIGTAEVLQQLKSIAPVIAVRGNNDKERWARAIPEAEVAEIAGVRIYVLHDLKEIAFDPADRRFQIVVSGHSHRPSIETRDQVLFLNPGSAGPRRFKLPITVAQLTVDGSSVKGEIIMLLQGTNRDSKIN
jgi:putative phosphoesterase